MIYILLFTIASLYLICTTWLFYLAIMMLKSNKDKLTKPAKIIATPMLVIGVILDVLLNLIVATVLFVEVPRELLFTSRCARHLHSNSFRGRFARSFCKHFLNPFDNDHCGKL